MKDYSKFIHKSRYARYNEEEGRRESWEETVDRYVDNVLYKVDDLPIFEVLRGSIKNMEVMPSMRAMMTAGPALDRDNVAGYNCSYLPVDHPRSFDECMYILLCGTGVGFSVERQYVSKLPDVPENFDEGPMVVVPDSKIGWAASLRKVISSCTMGRFPSGM